MKTLFNLFDYLLSNKFLIGGLFIIIIGCIFIQKGLSQKNIVEQNNLIQVNIISCSKVGKSYFLKFEYDHKLYTKRTKYSYCQENKKEGKIKLLANREYNEFIFLNEYQKDNGFVFGTIFLGFGIFLIFYCRNKKDKIDIK